MSGEGGRGSRGSRRWRRLLRLLHRDPVGETDEEIRFHLEMRARDYMERGMSEDRAREAARSRLGDMDEVRREVRHLTDARSRRERRRDGIAELRQDLRFGVRTLLRSPGFASMAGLTLALGIGATTAIFSLVYAVVLAPLPYPEPDRLVRVWETSPQGTTRNVVSSGNVVDWQQRARSFSVLGAHSGPFAVTITGEGEVSRVVRVRLQPEVMEALGVVPALGRTLRDEDAVGGDVALIGHGLWQSRYGGDPGVLNRRIVLDDVPYTVVGVMPPEFAFPGDEAQLWLPLADGDLDPTERTSHNYSVVARLAPGVTVPDAQAEMEAIVAAVAEEHPEQMTGWGARVVPLHEDLTRNVAALFWVLLGGVVVVVLVACGNLASVLLARAVTRRREVALRSALGAGRGRILRQLLTESVLLAVLGGAGGLLLAPLLLRVLMSAAPADIPLLERAAIDGTMLGFTAVAALGCALVFGLAPALRLARSDLQAALRSGRDASPGADTRLHRGLLVAQVAFSVVLLAAAGLFVRSFRALQETEVGFDPEGLVLMSVDLPRARYPEIREQVAFYDRLLERVAGLPGVAGAAGTSQAPGSEAGMTFSFAIEGRVAANPSGREDDETLHAVTPGYFEVLEQRLVSGRTFDARDRADGPPVVIVNESLARKHWPDGGAVGHRIAFRVGETPWREIVGVVADTRLASPDVEPEPGIYVPFAQKTWPWLSWTTVVARADPDTDPVAISGALRSALLELDPELPPLSLDTVAEAFRENTARLTFTMTLVGGFGLLALVLVVVGLNGLITYSVARQRREIGVRIALGARSGDVVGRILRSSLGLTALGAAGGVLAALALSWVVEGQLYGVSPMDATTYGLTVALVMVVALATAALPAVRAARTDPLLALKAD